MATTIVRYVQLGNKSYKVTEYQWAGPGGSIMTSRKVEPIYTIQEIEKKNEV
jgi:hypothetical protein